MRMIQRTPHKPTGLGFTLVELLVVIAIIGLLLTVILATLGQSQLKARDDKRITDLKQLEIGLELYYNVNRVYPAGNGGDITATLTALVPTYIPKLPVDPTGDHTYRYAAGANNQSYTLTAYLEKTNDWCYLGVDPGYTSWTTAYEPCTTP